MDFRFGTENLQEVKDIRITTSFQHVLPRAISATGPKVGSKVLSFIIAIVILSTSSPALTRYGSITTTLFISLVTLSATVLASPSTNALEIREIKVKHTSQMAKMMMMMMMTDPFTSNLLNHTQQQ